MADENPFAPAFMNPNASRTGLWDLRMMSAANRMESPYMRGARGMYGHQGVSGDPMLGGLAANVNQPDYSQFTYDPASHAAASKALAPYGLAPLEASQVRQNTLLPNSGFFGNHPMLSRALEGGIYGALAAHGGETPGESIQGALEGLVGGHRIQQGLWRQQFNRPFEAAGMMEQLEDMQQRRDLQGAQIKRYKDESEIQQERVRVEQERVQLGIDKLNATRPVPVEGGTYVYSNGEAPWKGIPYAPNKGPAEGTPPGWTFEAGAGARRGSNAWAGLGHLEPFARARGLNDPDKMTTQDWSNINEDYVRQQERMAGGKWSTIHGEPGNLTPEQQQRLKPINDQFNKLDSKEFTSQLRQEVMLDPAWMGKPIDAQNKEIENRRNIMRQRLQAQADEITKGGGQSGGGGGQLYYDQRTGETSRR